MIDGELKDRIQWVGKTNPLDWPITQELSGVEFKQADPQGGVRPIMPGGDVRWGEIIPAGWEGPIRYSVCLGRYIGARPVMACALEFYTGKSWTGAPLNTMYREWFSPGKGFGPLEELGNVVAGETLLFMLVAGSLRLKDTSDQPGPDSVQERSNIIRVTFTPNGVALALPPEGVGVPPPTSGGGSTGGTTGGGGTELPSTTAALAMLLQRVQALEDQNLGNRLADAEGKIGHLQQDLDQTQVDVANALTTIPNATAPASARIFGVRVDVPSVPLIRR